MRHYSTIYSVVVLGLLLWLRYLGGHNCMIPVTGFWWAGLAVLRGHGMTSRGWLESILDSCLAHLLGRLLIVTCMGGI